MAEISYCRVVGGTFAGEDLDPTERESPLRHLIISGRLISHS